MNATGHGTGSSSEVVAATGPLPCHLDASFLGGLPPGGHGAGKWGAATLPGDVVGEAFSTFKKADVCPEFLVGEKWGDFWVMWLARCALPTKRQMYVQNFCKLRSGETSGSLATKKQMYVQNLW
jgi:hypothetical protein